MGRKDVPLDICAVGEAAVAARNFKYAEIDALFSSPLIRCIQTASEFERVFNLPAQVVPGLEERAWGRFEGKPKVMRDKAVAGPGVESIECFRRRVLMAIGRIKEQATVPLIVTHSGVIRVLLGADADEQIPHLKPIIASWPDKDWL
ncbi:histidine phosphatase family protein [Roseivivax sp. THAF30]|uniref:histidine phosphatase family protein n=1 Tax=Roseivivax sp. THAF30 TaxID=2587852 RepID=UPI00352B6125